MIFCQQHFPPSILPHPSFEGSTLVLLESRLFLEAPEQAGKIMFWA
jgi:hypothetical protein